VWLGCAGAFEADFQKSLRSLFEILRARGVPFGVLSKERCTGDPAKRTGNEYVYQELANGNIEELRAAAPKKILTSCPHCVKTIGSDYRKFGYEGDVVHSSVFVEELTRESRATTRHARSAKASDTRSAKASAEREIVTFHDPCSLGRHAARANQPRALLTRFGADIKEPERTRDNPFC